MPLSTQIERDGELLAIGWGYFHVAAMTLAAALDDPECKLHQELVKNDEMPTDDQITLSSSTVFGLSSYGVMAATPLNGNSYQLKADYTFVDMVDGEVFELKTGDLLRAWR